MTENMFHEISNLLQGCVVIGVICLIILVFIFLVVFFSYYEKSLRIKKENDDDNLRKIIKDELHRVDRAMYLSNKYIEFLEKDNQNKNV